MPRILLVGDWGGRAVDALLGRGYELRRATRPREARTRTEGVDCAIVRSGEDDLATVEVLDGAAADAPVLYAADPDEADRFEPARSAGATDCVVLDGDHERLLARVDALAGDPTGGATADATTPSREDGGDASDAHAREVRTLLECAGSLLDAESADAVAEIAVRAAERVLGHELVAVHLLQGGILHPAANTERSLDVVDDLSSIPLADAPAEPAIRHGQSIELGAADLDVETADRLESVLVVPLGDHGVLSFGSTRSAGFADADRRIAELLAANATAALDRVHRVERIERLHHATRSMLDAVTAEDVAARAVEAAESILGYSIVGLHLLDDEGQALEPVAWTAATERDYGEPRPIVAGRGGPWRAFEEGRTINYDENRPEACQGTTPFESQMHVPIGAKGILIVAAHEVGAFDETDVQLARLLATNTARTLERVERTLELERYESVFETVTDMVYVLDDEGVITHATPALAEGLGYDRSDLVGRHVSHVVDDPESISRGVDLVQELVGEPPGTSRTLRVSLTAADGDELPVEVDVTLLPGEGFRGVVGSVRDVSDLIAVRRRLDSQQNRFEYLFEHIPDPVVEVDLEEDEATIVSVNGAFEEVFGFDAEEVRDRPINEVIVPEDDRERAVALDREFACDEIALTELERETRFGVREFLFRGVPYATADGETRGFGIYTDITDQRERERHLEVLQRVLRHNVRNDVNVLLGGIDRLEDEGADPDTVELLEETAAGLLAMSQKAKRIGRVLEADREQRATVDLASIARGVVDRYDGASLDATVRARLPETAPVVGSRAIEDALRDLVENAVEHAGEAPTVEVSVERGEGRTSVTVADDGPGIPEEERAVLQEAEITPLRHGSGLGLWLVKHATAASGGTVSFDETDADGASVTLSFRSADVPARSPTP